MCNPTTETCEARCTADGCECAVDDDCDDDLTCTDGRCQCNVDDDCPDELACCASDVELCVRLTWSTTTGDLDLFVTQRSNELTENETCSDESCYFGNCTEGSPTRVDWDGSIPLLNDDTFGAGPELMTVDSLPGGAYVVAVYMQPPSSDPTATATVQIAHFGEEIAELSRAMDPDTVWNVVELSLARALVAVPIDAVCLDAGGFCGDPAGSCP